MLSVSISRVVMLIGSMLSDMYNYIKLSGIMLNRLLRDIYFSGVMLCFVMLIVIMLNI